MNDNNNNNNNNNKIDDMNDNNNNNSNSNNDILISSSLLLFYSFPFCFVLFCSILFFSGLFCSLSLFLSYALLLSGIVFSYLFLSSFHSLICPSSSHLNLRSSSLVHFEQQPWWFSELLWRCSCQWEISSQCKLVQYT